MTRPRTSGLAQGQGLARARARGPSLAGLAWVLQAIMACSASPAVTQRTFAVHGQHRRQQHIELDLVTVRYLPRGVTLRVTLVNDHKERLRLEPEGILLAYQGLEYPLADLFTRSPIVLPPGGRTTLALRFDLGQAMGQTGLLRLRAAQRGSSWVEGLALPVPGSGSAPPASGSR